MAHIRRHPVSGRWQVRYRDPDGKEKSQVCDTKADADRFAATITADVVRGDYIDPRQGKVTVAEFAERWQTTRTHLAQATRDQDRYLLSRYILPAFGRREVASLRPSEIETWLARLEVAPATKAKALQKLSLILRLAVGDGAIKVNPCDGIRRPSQKPRWPRLLRPPRRWTSGPRRWCGSWPAPGSASVKCWRCAATTSAMGSCTSAAQCRGRRVCAR